MGKNTGFLEFDRAVNAAVPPRERVGSFDEFALPLDRARRMEQGARCMNCGVPFCQSGVCVQHAPVGCPLHNLIPEWNDELYRGCWGQALARLCKTNSFPEFTGRVCPAPCESACTCGLYGAPVTVRENELAIIEDGFRTGRIVPRPPQSRSGKHVAVVGSGPAGLAAADRLNRRGHSVTVFERDARPGGLLTYGIPNMKLDKQIVARRVALLEAEGVTFRTGVEVGVTVSAGELLEQFDAVVLCCGARQPRDIRVPGRDAGGVCFAVDYLSDVTRGLLGEQPDSGVSAKDRHVVVIGGGDTGCDCVATAIRQGCRSVTQLVRRPKEAVCSPAPWPHFAPGAKTGYGQLEAAAVFGEDPRLFQTSVKEILTDEAHQVCAVRVVQSEPVTDENGRMQMQEIPGSERVLPCELLLIAAGFSGCEPGVLQAFGVQLPAPAAERLAEDVFVTDNPKVFCAGDARRGASLVVWAIAEGRACAKQVDEFLMGYSNML